MITFRTTSIHDALVYNLPGGTYIITETITPDGYADAAPITFTVADNATEVHVEGTPASEFTRQVLMLDLADPSADQSAPGPNTPGNAVPATGEDNTFMVCMAAICIAVSAGITVFVLYRRKSSKDMNIDLLSMSAHKFHGPKGVGVLYARVGVLLQNVIYGGAQERGKRAGTENVAGIMGMAAALEEAVANMDAHAAYMEKLRNRLMEGLGEIPHSLLNGHPEKRLPNNVSFCFEGIEGESLLLLLDDKGIAASSGSACTSGDLDPSHVLLAMDRPHEIAHGSLRLTLSHENTMEEVEYTIEAVKEVVAYLRSISPVWRDLINGKSEFIIKEA